MAFKRWWNSTNHEIQNKNHVEDGPVINSRSLKLEQIWQNGDTTAVEANAEEVHDENKAQDALTCSNSPEKASNEQYMWSYQQPDGK